MSGFSSETPQGAIGDTLPRTSLWRLLATASLTTLTLLALGLGATPQTAGATQLAHSLFMKLPYAKKPGGKESQKLKGITPSGLRASFLVVGKQRIGGTTWVGLRLPSRPNRSVGWVRSERLEIRRSRAKLVLTVRKRKLVLFLGGKRAWRATVVVGKSSTPTPRGLFALYDRHRAWDDLRPWVFETTAHSRRLRTFEGVSARIALHGRHGKLWAPWGTASSNGCIRTPNWALRSIRKRATLGTPIQIR